MHAGIADLLTYAAGEPIDASRRAHIAACGTCRSELQRIAALRGRLAALPVPEPPAGGWNRVAAELDAAPRARAWPVAGLAAASAVAAAVALVMVTAPHDRRAPAAGAATQPAADMVAATGDVNALIAQSQHLESVLARLGGRRHLERAGTALTLDVLEQRIAYLDENLNRATAAESAADSRERLWEERVLLLDSLVKVRYAQAASELAF
jgi:hypothetical protein